LGFGTTVEAGLGARVEPMPGVGLGDKVGLAPGAGVGEM